MVYNIVSHFYEFKCVVFFNLFLNKQVVVMNSRVEDMRVVTRELRQHLTLPDFQMCEQKVPKPREQFISVKRLSERHQQSTVVLRASEEWAVAGKLCVCLPLMFHASHQCAHSVSTQQSSSPRQLAVQLGV